MSVWEHAADNSARSYGVAVDALRERLEASRVELAQGVTLYREDCRFILPTLKNIAACVTDPPYEISFMQKSWDNTGIAKDPKTWELVLASLLPGAHLVSFAGTRTYHRIASAIEDAGFECRDLLAWVAGSGFPKGRDIWKLDFDSAPELEQWKGFSTALKPAFEPACLARKPLSEKTVARNVLQHSTGAMNIDACRAGTESTIRTCNGVGKSSSFDMAASGLHRINGSDAGRWPANLMHDGSPEVLALFPRSKGGKETAPRGTGGIWSGKSNTPIGPQYDDDGSAARFFYCAKVSPKERGDSKHPTMKPISLMEWLCKLVTPPGGQILDPFMGSGSTGVAAVRNGFGFVGIEQDPESFETAKSRIEAELRQHNYRSVHPVKSITPEGTIMSDLLEIAGGKEAILRSAYAHGDEARTVPACVLHTARERFISAFSADIEAKLDAAHQMHMLMQGERPHAPSDDAEAWDETLICEADAVTSAALEPFGLWSGDAAKRWAQALETFSVLEYEWSKGAHTLAEFIWRERIETKDSTGKQLSALGITAKDIEAFWAIQSPGAPATVDAPGAMCKAGDTLALGNLRDGTEQMATVHAVTPAPVAPQAAEPLSVAPTAAPQSPVKKTRGRKRAHVALVLPSAIFQTLRAVGIKDNALAEATGIKRPTVSRVCAGEQAEIGISIEEFGKLQAFATAKVAELQDVLGTLSFFEVTA